LRRDTTAGDGGWGKIVPAIVLGQRAQLYAWRSNVTGFVRPPSLTTVFWNVEKK